MQLYQGWTDFVLILQTIYNQQDTYWELNLVIAVLELSIEKYLINRVIRW